jgi:hypothetical protein
LHLQSKLMEFKVDKAIDSMGRMASAPGADSLASTNMRRISADLVVMRNAARLTRNSMRNLNVGQQSAGGAAAGDVEAGGRSVELEAARMHQSIAQVCLLCWPACCGMSWPVDFSMLGACKSRSVDGFHSNHYTTTGSCGQFLWFCACIACLAPLFLSYSD